MIQCTLDAMGNRVASLDADQGLSTSSFDALQRLIASTDARGGTVAYGYDAQDHLRTVQDPDGLSTAYTYDGLGNLTDLSSPDTGSTHSTYDAAGNRLTQTDARGVVTTSSYDALNRLTQAVYGSGAGAVTVSYTYDQGTNGVGRLTTLTGGGSTLAYTYDRVGRVTARTQTVAGVAQSVHYTYTAGDLATLQYPSGQTLRFHRDAAGQIDAIERDTGNFAGVPVVSGVQYMPFGGVAWFANANGDVQSRTDDLDGRIVRIALNPAVGEISSTPAPAGGPPTWADYGYDPAGRLTAAQLPQRWAGEDLVPAQSLAYTYSGVGDRLTAEVDGQTTAYHYTAGTHHLGSLSGALAESRSYDAAGNTVQRGATTFTYDARNRLTQVSGNVTASYTYNGRGERVAKQVSSGITRFAYDEQGQLLGEYSATGTPIREYVWLQGMPVAMLVPSPNASPKGGVPTVLHYPIYTDHLGTPRGVADPNGTLVWRWPLQAKPFGEDAPEEDPDGDLAPFALNLRFPGQYFDPETGLHYNYFRDYDPTTGRYVESDPIGLDGGLSTYSYADNNTIGGFDSEGAKPFFPGCNSGDCHSPAPIFPTPSPRPMPAPGSSNPDLTGFAVGAFNVMMQLSFPGICSSPACPPCKTISGRIVAVGTVGYRPLDVLPSSKFSHGVWGSHHNLGIANQIPYPNCDCFWQPQRKAAMPSEIQPTWIPMEPFAN